MTNLTPLKPDWWAKPPVSVFCDMRVHSALALWCWFNLRQTKNKWVSYGHPLTYKQIAEDMAAAGTGTDASVSVNYVRHSVELLVKYGYLRQCHAERLGTDKATDEPIWFVKEAGDKRPSKAYQYKLLTPKPEGAAKESIVEDEIPEPCAEAKEFADWAVGCVQAMSDKEVTFKDSVTKMSHDAQELLFDGEDGEPLDKTLERAKNIWVYMMETPSWRNIFDGVDHPMRFFGQKIIDIAQAQWEEQKKAEKRAEKAAQNVRTTPRVIPPEFPGMCLGCEEWSDDPNHGKKCQQYLDFDAQQGSFANEMGEA